MTVSHKNGKNGNGKKTGNGHKQAERPAQARIDQKKFEQYCARQYTLVGIAGAFDVSDNTLTRWIENTYGRSVGEVVAEKREIGHNTVREQLYLKASQGWAWAVIWYGKQFLGQSDRVDQTVRPGAPAPDPQVWILGDGRELTFRP